MKILELEWVMKNKDKLNEDEIKQLEGYGLFNQYERGELHQNGMAMIHALGLIKGIYDKYNNK